jgi:predicted Zn-dependent protease
MESIVLRLGATSHSNLVKKAVKMLNDAFSDIKPKIIFHISESKEYDFDYEVEFISKARMISLIGKEALGFCDKLNHKIYILYDPCSQDESILVSTLMHEILHALGLPHLPEVHSLMYEKDTGVRGVTVYDLKALAQRFHRSDREVTQR